MNTSAYCAKPIEFSLLSYGVIMFSIKNLTRFFKLKKVARNNISSAIFELMLCSCALSIPIPSIMVLGFSKMSAPYLMCLKRLKRRWGENSCL